MNLSLSTLSLTVALAAMLTGCANSEPKETSKPPGNSGGSVQPVEPVSAANSDANIIDIGLPIAQQAAATESKNGVRTIKSIGLSVDDSGQAAGYYVVTTILLKDGTVQQVSENGITQVFLYSKGKIIFPQGLEKPSGLVKCVMLAGKESLLGYNAAQTLMSYKNGQSTPLMADLHQVRVTGGISDKGELLLCGSLDNNKQAFCYNVLQQKLVQRFNSLDWHFWQHEEKVKSAIVPDYRCSIEGMNLSEDEKTVFAAVNASQQIQTLGSISEQRELAHAFLISKGAKDETRDLGILPGQTETHAVSVNAAGQVIGYCGRTPVSGKAFLYDDQMVAIGTLGGSWCNPEAINNSGQVVGSSQTASGKEHAFLYQGKKMIDLNDYVKGSGWELIHAFDINNKGIVVGEGQIRGETHAFLLTLP